MGGGGGLDGERQGGEQREGRGLAASPYRVQLGEELAFSPHFEREDAVCGEVRRQVQW
jgi:hypothetical protein